MSCNDLCCENTYNMGCVSLCSSGIELPVEALSTEQHSVNLSFNGMIHSFVVDGVLGQPIAVPTELINEDYEYSVQVKNSSGEILQYEVEGESPVVQYDCFKFRTRPTFVPVQTNMGTFNELEETE